MSTRTTTDRPAFVDVDLARVREVLERVRAVLSPEDHACLEGLVETLIELTRLVRERGTTIARLRQLFGLSSSEKTADVLGNNSSADLSSQSQQDREQPALDGSDENAAAVEHEEGAGESDCSDAGNVATNDDNNTHRNPKRKPRGHGRIPASAYKGASVTSVTHGTLHVGDLCPGCEHGTLYSLAPRRIVRIVGQAPLAARCWDCEQLRCSGCGVVHAAAAPAEAQGPKYAPSAVAMMTLLRYGAGLPLHRLAGIQDNLQIPVPESTQWEVARDNVPALRPIYEELLRRAADARIIYNDDTSMRILEFMGKRRQALLGTDQLPDPDRSGLFTTGVVAATDHRLIALFFTGRKHAGENLERLLDQRSPELDPPIHMCDGLDRNRPGKHPVIETNCNAHGRRHVVDEVTNFPDECRHVLEELGKIFHNEAHCRQRGLTPEERLHFHQEHSAAIMADLKTWVQKQLDEKNVEPNSGLGKAFRYLLKRWDKLTLFLRVPGAPLDNNVCERMLKRAIRHRKNSLFYRTARGAHVGDIYMSLLHTAELSGENAFEYLTALLENEADVATDPAAWLPWTFRATLAARDGPGTQAA